MFWNGILISLGLLLGENWNILIDYISRYNFIFIVLTILVFLVIFINKFLKKKKNTEVNSE
jgi:membrane protein DedA with SNARE-associated domain